MQKGLLWFSCVLLASWGMAPCFAQESIDDIESPKHQAWDMLQTAIASKSTTQRTDGVRALGLLRDNPRARTLAEDALDDRKFEVRAAAATALGQMSARESIPRLQRALADEKIPVV